MTQEKERNKLAVGNDSEIIKVFNFPHKETCKIIESNLIEKTLSKRAKFDSIRPS